MTPKKLYGKGGMIGACVLQCQQSMARAVATEERLGIEYDEQTTCDVCRDVSTHACVTIPATARVEGDITRIMSCPAA